MSRPVAVGVAALLLGGCYLEAGMAYYPRVKQTTTATADTQGMEIRPAEEASSGAIGFLLKAGFYFDLPFGGRCKLGCAPVSIGIAQGGTSVDTDDDTAAVERSMGTGTEFRLDVDLPRKGGDYKLRATAIYGGIKEGDVNFNNVVQEMGMGGKTQNSGRTLFAGMTYAREENYAGVTFGVSHMSWDSQGRFSNGNIPGTTISATGVQLRFIVAAPSSPIFTLLGFLKPGKPSYSKETPPQARKKSCFYVTDKCTKNQFGRTHCTKRKVCY